MSYITLLKERAMSKNIAEETVVIPRKEYRLLKEIYKTVKRQNFLLRVAEAEYNLDKGKIRNFLQKIF